MDQQLAKQEVSTLPTYLKQYSEASVQDIKVNELKIPMLKIAQMQSQETVDGKAKLCDIVNSITTENLGQAVDVIILKPFINWVWFDDDRTLKGKSANGITWEQGELAGQDIDQDEAYKYKRYNFYVATIANGYNPLPNLVSMGGTSAKAGSKLYQTIATDIMKAKLPCFARIYTLATKKDQNDYGTFGVWTWEQKPGYTSEALAAQAATSKAFIDKTAHVVDDVKM